MSEEIIGRLTTDGDWDYSIADACKIEPDMWESLKVLATQALRIARSNSGFPIAELSYVVGVIEHYTPLEDDYSTGTLQYSVSEKQPLFFSKVSFWPHYADLHDKAVSVAVHLITEGDIPVTVTDLPDIEVPL